MTEASPLNGLVLAGGRSRRMGSEKCALALHGVPQTRFCSDLLAPIVDSVFVSARDAQREDPSLKGLDVIQDAYTGMGPMGGLLSAMDAHPARAWLIVACDLPLVTEAALRLLVNQRDPARQATAFMATDGFIEPLLAIYEPGIRAHLDERRAAENYSLREVLTDADVKMVCPPDDRVLFNVNTPRDLEEAQALLGNVERGAS